MRRIDQAQETLSRLARQVRRRILLVSALRWLIGASPWIGLSLGLLLVLNRLSSWGLGSLGLLLLGVGPWLLYGVWRVLRDWPDAQGALLRWDAHAGRGGAYGSAWEFERRAERRPGEELHYQRVCREAQRAQEELNRDFPLPKPGAPSLILPVMLLALALSGLGQRQERLAREEKAEEQRREARAQAEAVRNVAEELAELQETGEESEAGRELAAAVEETAESLSGLEERDADDVINELSERARRLEELAKGLGEADGKWVSEHFGRTLAEQIDTEDLGEAVLDRDAERGAEEAGELSRHLAAESASGPFAVRMGQGLRRTMEAAAPEDEDRLLVQYVGDATEQLANGRPEGAAEAFQAMAGYFQGMVQSRRKQTRMEQLAEELRQAGMRIARQGGDSTKVAGTEPEAIPPGEARPLAEHAPTAPLNPGMRNEDARGGEPEGPGQVPGQAAPASRAEEGPQADPSADGEPGEAVALRAPVPGEPPQNEPGVPGLSAPVPGEDAAQAGRLADQLGAEGSSSSGVPGMEAGVGRSELVPEETTPLTAKRETKLETRWNSQGESILREVARGEARPESAQAPADVAAEFLEVEEAALSEKRLPLARQGQVERYFRGVRRRFEEE